MKQGISVGLAPAKRVFQTYGIDRQGSVVPGDKLRRARVLGCFAALERYLVRLGAYSFPGRDVHWTCPRCAARPTAPARSWETSLCLDQATTPA